MLHIILLILKILGIILLSILLLLLLVLCAVLFVSVTYRVQVEKKETLQVSAVGGWLFRALSVHYSLNGANDWKQDLRVKVFGITILNFFEEKKPKRKKKKRSRKRSKEKKDNAIESLQAPAAKMPDAAAGQEDGPALPAVVDVPEKQQKKGSHRQQKPENPSFIRRIHQFFSKLLYAIRSICDKIKGIVKGIGSAVGNLRETAQNLRERKDVYLEFWNLEEHRRARGAIYKELRYLWKKSRPRRIEGEVRFGFEDPSLTGMCMSALSVLYAWYPKKFRLNPDFDQEILEGKLLIKGRIRLYVAALILWRVWFNKDIRHMYEHWQEL